MWSSGGRAERLQLRAVGSGWSAPFMLNAAVGQESHVALPVAAGGAIWLVRVEVSVRSLGIASVTMARAGRAPVLLHNCTAAAMRYRQSPGPECAEEAAVWRPLPPHSATPYSWERTLEPHLLEARAAHHPWSHRIPPGPTGSRLVPPDPAWSPQIPPGPI